MRLGRTTCLLFISLTTIHISTAYAQEDGPREWGDRIRGEAHLEAIARAVAAQIEVSDGDTRRAEYGELYSLQDLIVIGTECSLVPPPVGDYSTSMRR